MGIFYRQSIAITAGKQPTSGPVKEKIFEIPNYETIDVTSWGEAASQRFVVPDGSVDLPLSIGTIQEAEMLAIRVDSVDLELNVKLVNVNGTTVNLPLLPQRTSIFHTKFSSILVTNTSGSAIEGVFFVAGD